MNSNNITVFIADDEAVDLLLQLNSTPGLTARFSEHAPGYDESKVHEMYSLELAALVQLLVYGVGLLGGITALSAALVNYKTARLARDNNKSRNTVIAVVVINNSKIEVLETDTVETLEEKIRGQMLAFVDQTEQRPALEEQDIASNTKESSEQ
jgi:hypothetical protein